MAERRKVCVSTRIIIQLSEHAMYTRTGKLHGIMIVSIPFSHSLPISCFSTITMTLLRVLPHSSWVRGFHNKRLRPRRPSQSREREADAKYLNYH